MVLIRFAEWRARDGCLSLRPISLMTDPMQAQSSARQG